MPLIVHFLCIENLAVGGIEQQRGAGGGGSTHRDRRQKQAGRDGLQAHVLLRMVSGNTFTESKAI
jgi:hypothetical protein